MAYAVIRTDKMHGTDNRADLVTGVAEVELQNGSVVKLVGFNAKYKDVWTLAAPAADEEFTNLGIVATPEMFYDERVRALDAFTNEAGELVRVYKLEDKDEFSLTAEGFSGTPAVGAYVACDGTNKLAASSSDTNAIGKIEAIEVVGRYTYYVVRVTR